MRNNPFSCIKEYFCLSSNILSSKKKLLFIKKNISLGKYKPIDLKSSLKLNASLRKFTKSGQFGSRLLIKTKLSFF